MLLTPPKCGHCAVAAANGAEAYPAMQLIPLAGNGRYIHRGQPGVCDRPPREGSLPPELVLPLVDVLTRDDGFGLT
jgi:hypothetical protein